MKKMFTLRGVSGCGKSTKIKQIADWIMTNYPYHLNRGINLSQGDITGLLEVGRLKIGFVSAGDLLGCVEASDHLFSLYPDIDIIINASRTKGATNTYVRNNYNYSTGWLQKSIYVKKFNPSNPTLESTRDRLILDELKTWLTGLEKI